MRWGAEKYALNFYRADSVGKDGRQPTEPDWLAEDLERGRAADAGKDEKGSGASRSERGALMC